MRVKDTACSPVLFMDAIHPAHNSMPLYDWILRGKRSEIPANTAREHMNIDGAVNAETLVVFAVEAETIYAAAFGTTGNQRLHFDNWQDAVNQNRRVLKAPSLLLILDHIRCIL